MLTTVTRADDHDVSIDGYRTTEAILRFCIARGQFAFQAKNGEQVTRFQLLKRERRSAPFACRPLAVFEEGPNAVVHDAIEILCVGQEQASAVRTIREVGVCYPREPEENLGTGRRPLDLVYEIGGEADLVDQ